MQAQAVMTVAIGAEKRRLMAGSSEDRDRIVVLALTTSKVP